MVNSTKRYSSSFILLNDSNSIWTELTEEYLLIKKMSSGKIGYWFLLSLQNAVNFSFLGSLPLSWHAFLKSFKISILFLIILSLASISFFISFIL